MKRNKGITLIALVITIIVLLILAGVSIATLTGENGLLKQATTSKEETIKAQLKEEIELAIAAIQAEELPKGKQVTLESLAGRDGQLASAEELIKQGGITAELGEPGIVGEYKGYNYTIDDKFKVTIEDKVQGISISYKVNPTGYTNQNITLTITAESTNGAISKIENTKGNLQSNEDGTYTITKNGNYEFTVIDETNETKSKTVTINTIDKIKPNEIKLTISNITTTGFTIKADTEDGEETDESVKSGIEKYVYYVKSSKDSEYTAYESTKASYTFNTLETGTEYTIYIVAYDKAGNINTSTEEIQKTNVANKKIYIDSINGNDTTGNGTEGNPYLTLAKITEEGIIKNGYSYTILLMNGEYDLPNDIITLTNDNSIDIFGNKQNTIINLPNKVIGNQANGDQNVGNIDYSLNFYRLIMKLDWNVNSSNYWRSKNNVSFNNVVLMVNGARMYGGILCLPKCTINNCISVGNNTINIRCDVGETTLTNSYGRFSSGYGTTDANWNYQTNYITTAPQVNSTTYQIIESESIWKNVGTGTNPDGTKANLGVYGGEYSWEN